MTTPFVTYVTRQHDMVDAICHDYYGGTAGSVEGVLAANPGLADLMPILPEGIRIVLPELPAPPTRTLRIWRAAA